MTYFPTLHDYLHQSSLLLQAYPTARITTKYSLPRRHAKPRTAAAAAAAETSETDGAHEGSQKQKREPAATLTLRTFHPESGICLKYKTDKAAEVGRLMAGLGRLAKGETIDLPTDTDTAATATTGAGVSVGEGVIMTSGDAMDVDEQTSRASGTTPAKTTAQMTQQQQQPGGGSGGKKKKKGKK